jgi:hypothetical protein
MVWIPSLYLWPKPGSRCHNQSFHSTSFWACYGKYANGVICPISIRRSFAWSSKISGNPSGKPVFSCVLRCCNAMHVRSKSVPMAERQRYSDQRQLFTDTQNPESWMRHAKGLSQLVKIRGPDRYTNELDITLLRASRGLIVSLELSA